MILTLLALACGTPEPPAEPTPPTSEQEGAVVPVGVDEHGMLRYDISDPKVPFPAWRLVDPAGGQPGTADMAGRHQGPRCDHGEAGVLELLRPERAAQRIPLAELGAHPAAKPLEGGRHGGEAALALDALLEGADEVEARPCDGSSRVYAARDLRARPGRVVLVVGNRDRVKLLDLDQPDGDRVPQVRGVTQLVFR